MDTENTPLICDKVVICDDVIYDDLCPNKRKYHVTFWNIDFVVRMIPIKATISKHDILKFEPAHFEAETKCVVTHATLHADDKPLIRFSLMEILDIGESLTMQSPNLESLRKALK